MAARFHNKHVLVEVNEDGSLKVFAPDPNVHLSRSAAEELTEFLSEWFGPKPDQFDIDTIDEFFDTFTETAATATPVSSPSEPEKSSENPAREAATPTSARRKPGRPRKSQAASEVGDA